LLVIHNTSDQAKTVKLPANYKSAKVIFQSSNLAGLKGGIVKLPAYESVVLK
jgi:hypothetical protein